MGADAWHLRPSVFMCGSLSSPSPEGHAVGLDVLAGDAPFDDGQPNGGIDAEMNRKRADQYRIGQALVAKLLGLAQTVD